MADPVQVLPAKEQSVFRSLAKLQEQKQYKKVLKLTDGILKSHPNHGETLSFKALALSSLKRKDEAYAAAKMALIKTKMRSYVAWHIFGLIYRSDRNYAEAIKCYRKALALSDNQQILKDLSILQIQIRDLKGYAETRKTMLAKTSTQRSNWVGFSLAQHMCGNYNVALLILDTCLGFMRSHNDRDLYEQSEIFLYKVMLLEETGALEPAVAFLDAFESRIVDKIGWREKKAQLLLALGKFDEAKELYNTLLDINPESFDYHRGLQACLLQSKSISSLSGCQLPVQDDRYVQNGLACWRAGAHCDCAVRLVLSDDILLTGEALSVSDSRVRGRTLREPSGLSKTRNPASLMLSESFPCPARCTIASESRGARR